MFNTEKQIPNKCTLQRSWEFGVWTSQGWASCERLWQDFGTKEESSRLVSEHFEVQASSQLVSEVFIFEVQVPTSKGAIPKDTSKF